MEFVVGQVVDVFNPDGEHEPELEAQVLEVTDDTVIVRPKNKNIPEQLAELFGMNDMRFEHNLDGSAKDTDDSDNEGWSIKPRVSA